MKKPKKHYGDHNLSSLMRTLATKLKAYRSERGMSQSELARQSKVALSTINEIENQVISDVRLSTISALAKTLNKNSLELLSRSELDISDHDKRRT